MAMCESLDANSPLPPPQHEHDPHAPLTLNTYITHPIKAEPEDLLVSKDGPQGPGRNLFSVLYT